MERSFSSHTGFKVRELAAGLKKTGLGIQMEHSEGAHDEAQSRAIGRQMPIR
jgi:hypothetical protein